MRLRSYSIYISLFPELIILNYIGIDSCSTNSPYLNYTYLDYFFSYVKQQNMTI